MNKLLATCALATIVSVAVPFTSSDAQQTSTARDTVLDTRILPVEVEREVT